MLLFGERTKAQKAAKANKVLDAQESKLDENQAPIDTEVSGKGNYNTSQYNKMYDAKCQDAKLKLANDGYSANPYDTETQEQRTSKKDVLAISNASYGNSLLEKVVNNTNELE